MQISPYPGGLGLTTGTVDLWIKNELPPWLKKCWCIPPEQNAEFV